MVTRASYSLHVSFHFLHSSLYLYSFFYGTSLKILKKMNSNVLGSKSQPRLANLSFCMFFLKALKTNAGIRSQFMQRLLLSFPCPIHNFIINVDGLSTVT